MKYNTLKALDQVISDLWEIADTLYGPAREAVDKARIAAQDAWNVVKLEYEDKGYSIESSKKSGYDRNNESINALFSKKTIKSATDEELRDMRENNPQSINESDYQKVVEKLNGLRECNEWGCNFSYYKEPDGSFTIVDKNEAIDVSEPDYVTKAVRKVLMDMGYYLEPVHTFQDFTLGLIM